MTFGLVNAAFFFWCCCDTMHSSKGLNGRFLGLSLEFLVPPDCVAGNNLVRTFVLASEGLPSLAHRVLAFFDFSDIYNTSCNQIIILNVYTTCCIYHDYMFVQQHASHLGLYGHNNNIT